MKERMNQELREHYKLVFLVVSVLIIATMVHHMLEESPLTEASTLNEKYYQCITLEENTSLWNIADSYCSEEYDSYDEYIAEVKHINNLTDDTIYSGACLVIPYYAPPQ